MPAACNGNGMCNADILTCECVSIAASGTYCETCSEGYISDGGLCVPEVCMSGPY